MIKNLIAGFAVILSFTALAQNIKTGVLVVGATPAGYAAAIQSAKSGAKTLLIDAGKFQTLSLTEQDTFVKAGIFADFKKLVDSLQKSPLKDSQTLTPEFTGRIFKAWADTVKNLTIMPNAIIKKLEKDGKGWEIDLLKGDIKADVLLDATADNRVSSMAGFKASDGVAINAGSLYADKKYRTSVAVFKQNGVLRTLPLSSLIVPEVENLVLAASPGSSATLLSGQAAGAVAAYCVFFKTTTKKINVRAIQNELLTYKSRIIKYDDVDDSDSSVMAIQRIGITGILKAKEENGRVLFMPDGSVSTEELKQPLRELYSRSQIWFFDNRAEKLSLENVLSLIKFLGSRGEELNKEVAKAWKGTLRFKGEFDLKKIISRRELAILLDTYLQPHIVGIDLEGNIKR